MTGSALFRFTLLAAIWGASFLFMRILAPEVGGVWTAQSRLTIGALALFAFVWLRKIPLQMHQWRHYLIAGVLNCAIPFAMYGVAGTILPAGYSAVLNSSVPLWATVFAAMMLGDKITPLRMLALLLGVVGVIFVARPSADVPMTHVFFTGFKNLDSGISAKRARAHIAADFAVQGYPPRIRGLHTTESD